MHQPYGGDGIFLGMTPEFFFFNHSIFLELDLICSLLKQYFFSQIRIYKLLERKEKLNTFFEKNTP